MAECSEGNISERILAVLWPNEFPELVEEIERHVRQCQQCDNQLNSMRRLAEFLTKHKEQLSCALDSCPSTVSLVEFALGEVFDPAISTHAEVCPECRNSVELVRELSTQEFEGRKTALTPETKATIQNAVSKYYGSAQPIRVFSIGNRVRSILEGMNLRSMAAGALAGVALMLVLTHGVPTKDYWYPVLSDAQWEEQASAIKKVSPDGAPSFQEKSHVALILMVSGRDLKDPDKIYGEIDIVKRLGGSLKFISPRRLRTLLEDSSAVRGVNRIAELAFEKTSAKYVLIFQISERNRLTSLVGTLFQRNKKSELYSMSQTGIKRERVPARVTALSMDLLAEAEDL